ncbi:MAG: M14 family metallopeptidase [Phycisphaerales bacterium]
MTHRIKLKHRIAALLCSFIVLVLVGTSLGRIRARKPKAGNPASHSFPALGIGSQRKVPVVWNRFYDHAGLGAILARLRKAFPELTRLYSVGKSSQGRDMWCLEVTARSVGEPNRKPGMYIDGNIHGNEVQAGETVAYTAWYLCHQYSWLEKVSALLDERVFYLLPTINPDGRDSWLRRGGSARSGLEPTDDDGDGLADEDDSEDLNGDGLITMMRIKDPHGRYKLHPDYPEYLMVRAKPDEPGEYTRLGWEGIDNDGDGRINEDSRGGYDMNRNWAYDWQPSYIQRGAKDYPFSQPETHAVAKFVLAHPNIAAAQSYHNSGGMILRSPGSEGGQIQRQDERVLTLIAERGEKILPFYRSMIIWKDLYTAWGSELDWLYGGRGILSFSNELWTSRNLYKTPGSPSDEQGAEFIEHVLMGEGVVPWQPYEHPTYGKIEIGGRRKEWGRLPPSFLLEEELHRNMAFTLYHAEMMPLIKIRDVEVEKLGDNLFKIWVTVENQRLIPTRTAQDVAHHISSPDVVSIQGADLRVLSGGQVTDRFFRRVRAVKRRPERVELAAISGMSAARVQFVVEGKGQFTITVDSAKGGLLKTSQLL